MINPAPAAPMSDRLLACATYLSPNEHEAAILAGHSIDVSNGINMEDVAVVSQAFQARGWRTSSSPWGKTAPSQAGKNGIHHTHCVKMEHVADPTAAGDSFVAAFCTGLTAVCPGRGPGFCQPHRRHHCVPYGRHAQPAHGGGGPAAPCGAGLPGL